MSVVHIRGHPHNLKLINEYRLINECKEDAPTPWER